MGGHGKLPEPRGCRLSRRRLLGAGLVAAKAAALLRPRMAVGQDIRYFRIGTGETGGFLFLLGGIVASAVSNPPGSRTCEQGGSCGVPGLIAVAQTTAGSMENVESIDAGRLDSGLSQADVAYWAFHGKDVFRHSGALTKLRAIANLYQESLHIIVRADSSVRTIADLKGRRVGLGPKDSGSLLTARLVLKAFGLTEKRLHPDYSDLRQAIAKFEQGTLDALIAVDATPAPSIAGLAERLPIRLLSVQGERIADLRRSRDFLTVGLIPAGTYGNKMPVTTIGIGVLWLVSAELGEGLVYDLARALWNKSNRRVLDETGALGRKIRPDTALQAISIPIHPGAQRYYDEVERVPARSGKP